MKNQILKMMLVLVLLAPMISVLSQTDEELKQKIENINKAMTKAMIEGNYSVGLNYYAPDAVSMPNQAPMVQGVDAIKKQNDAMVQSGAKFKIFETKTLQIKSCGNQITEIGTYQMSMTIPGMPNDFEDNGKYLTIWEKQPDGSLKIKVEMWNTDVDSMSKM
jgi:ketosteroid isomerase-like protein